MRIRFLSTITNHILQFFDTENKNQKVDSFKEGSDSKSCLQTSEIEVTGSNSLARTDKYLDQASKGIFACPKYIDLFDNKDDVRIK